MPELNKRAARARHKKAALGEDIDCGDYPSAAPPHPQLEQPGELPAVERNQLLTAGIDVEERERAGTFLQKDGSVLLSRTLVEGLEVLPIREALQRYGWLEDYYWRLVPVDADKYTARTQLELHNGYLIRALPGARIALPVQSCLYLASNGFGQNVHNLVIAEEGSEMHVITGCATAPDVERALHLGVSEFFVKRYARLSFTMIHNWGAGIAVRPRSVGRVEEGGLLLSNYICLHPVGSLQMYPSVSLVGTGAVARLHSLLIGSPGSDLDIGGRVRLEQAGTRAEIISRAISNGGRIVARGNLVGAAAGARGHLECRGLLLNGGSIDAVPELSGLVDGVELSHEAAVGKLAREEILYLMSRGLAEEEATATLVRGFLNVDIPGLPAGLLAEIERAVQLSQREML